LVGQWVQWLTGNDFHTIALEEINMIEIYKTLTGKYDSTVTSNCVTSREKD